MNRRQFLILTSVATASSTALGGEGTSKNSAPPTPLVSRPAGQRSQIEVTRRWLVWHDPSRQVQPWAWPDVPWSALTAEHVRALPGACEDMARYSPVDGLETLTPINLARELPQCRTSWAAYIDGDHVVIAIQGANASAIDPRLAPFNQDDFGCAFQLDGSARGLYFGLNQNGEHVCWAQVWDRHIQPPDAFDDPFWAEQQKNPWRHMDGYEARLLKDADYTTALWRIERARLERGIKHGRIRFTASRRCYPTNEMVAWGSGTYWAPRTAEMGELFLGPASQIHDGKAGPYPRRVEMYATADKARLIVTWAGLPDEAMQRKLAKDFYGKFFPNCVVIVNGQESVAELAPTTEHELELDDGELRIEVLSGFDPPTVMTMQHLSGQRIITGRHQRETADSKTPSRQILVERFASWHESAERVYHGEGRWGQKKGRGIYNISHNGAFYATPYALACLHLDRRPVYVERATALCERALTMQKPEGWFPAVMLDPQGAIPFRDGAFDTGSAGECLMLGYQLTGKSKYLHAARRIVDAYQLYPYEVNHNYAAFALWHLSAMLNVQAEPTLLDLAVYYAEHHVARNLTPDGIHGGHNYYGDYGAITLKGLARLLAVMPRTHGYRPQLRDAVVRMSNHMLFRQQRDGTFSERNRRYIGYTSLKPAIGLAWAALALETDDAERIRPGLIRALHTTKRIEGEMIALMRSGV